MKLKRMDFEKRKSESGSYKKSDMQKNNELTNCGKNAKQSSMSINSKWK